MEAAGIRDAPSGPLMRIGHDRVLTELPATVRRGSGGGTVENAAFFATDFATAFAHAGIDFLSTSRSGKFAAARPRIGEAAYPSTGLPGYECMPTHLSDHHGPLGRNVAPTTAAIVGMTRQSLADPASWPPPGAETRP